uniref:Rad21/Rec8-like protein N-terminal domain-containing protein n=1 Tax=Solanum lycopersicum TaxID=4081 RepID=A0A3Q7H0P4_SOLLC
MFICIRYIFGVSDFLLAYVVYPELDCRSSLVAGWRPLCTQNSIGKSLVNSILLTSGEAFSSTTTLKCLNSLLILSIRLLQFLLSSEQILNPSVPMALRLSGILMGGVVIVYEHKVKLLYEDVTRLMVVTFVFDPNQINLFLCSVFIKFRIYDWVQINEAWKVKAATDPTLLPKGKSQAKYAAITLPENREEELPEIEQTLRNPDTVTMMDFEQTSYFTMRLDNADLYDKPNAQEEPAKDLHQVDPDNITLAERFESHHTDMFNHFERFDIEGDEETQMNYTQPEDAQIPSTPVQSPPREQAHQRKNVLLSSTLDK